MICRSGMKKLDSKSSLTMLSPPRVLSSDRHIDVSKSNKSTGGERVPAGQQNLRRMQGMARPWRYLSVILVSLVSILAVSACSSGTASAPKAAPAKVAD